MVGLLVTGLVKNLASTALVLQISFVGSSINNSFFFVVEKNPY